MGYYTGAGVTRSGGSTSTVIDRFRVNSTSYVKSQKDTFTSLTKSGVSLATAQAETSSSSLSDYSYTVSGGTRYIPGGQGTRVETSYSRIGDSNLYELNINTHTLTCS